MNIIISDFTITAPTREQLRTVLNHPFLTSDSFNSFYSIDKDDDRQYMLAPELIEDGNTNTIKVHTSTRGDIPFSFFKALLDIEPSLSIDVASYDGNDDEHPYRCTLTSDGILEYL